MTMKHHKARYACQKPSRSGFKTTMRYARKRGQSGLNAHPSVLPAVRKTRKPLSKAEWHIAYIIRCARRGELDKVSGRDLRSE